MHGLLFGKSETETTYLDPVGAGDRWIEVQAAQPPPKLCLANGAVAE
jgi:hypothetical protein